MFGDAMYEEEERLRRAEDGREDRDVPDDEVTDIVAAGGLDERLRRRQAIAELLREVGGR
jgi:hypothetical protein